MKPHTGSDTLHQFIPKAKVIYICYFSLTFSFSLFSTENLLQNSVDDSWTDSNLNRVSVIQFQEETKAEEEDDEAAAERRVRKLNNAVPFSIPFTTPC